MKNNFLQQLTMYLGIGIMAMVFSFGFLAKPAQATTATGTIVSQVFDTGGLVAFGTITWNASTSASSTITMRVRTATTSNMTGATAWASCTDVASGTDISLNSCVADGQRYVQYMASFTTDYVSTSTFVTAELYDVTINYNAMATLVSSWYNTTASDNVINKLQWNETKPGNTEVLFQLRTAPDSSGSPGSPSNWMGTTSANDYYTDPAGGETINNAHKDSASDQWIQYKVFLISDGTSSPSIASTSILYDAIIPTITSISPNSTTTSPTSINLTINGTEFASGATVRFALGSQTATATVVNFINSNQLTCTVSFTNMTPGRYDVTVTNPSGQSATLAGGFHIEQNTGDLVSAVKDVGVGYGLGIISWTATTTATSTVTMRVRSSNNPGMSGATDWSACNLLNNGDSMATNNCVVNGQRYLQYQAILTTNYATSSVFDTAQLADVTVQYYTYASSSLISSWFDTFETHNVISNITWSETIPGLSDVGFQFRTASDSGGSPGSPSAWLGPTSGSDYYSNPAGGTAINATHRDGYDDRWVQYRVTLMPDGINAPTAGTTTISYVTSSATPTVVTSPPAWLGSTNVKAIGRVADSGTGPISRRGFEYGLTATNTWSIYQDVYKFEAPFDLVLPDLTKGTTYYVRAFAVNARGTSTGEYVQFSTNASTTLNSFILKTRTILKSNMIVR